jgi:hypothetical protein
MSCEDDGTVEDLHIKQGSLFSIQWPVLDRDGNAVPLDGWTGLAQVRRYKDSEEVLYTWSTEDGSIEFQDGHVKMNVPADVSSAWTWFEGSYDLELTSPQGVPTRVKEGKVYVSREVTRA